MHLTALVLELASSAVGKELVLQRVYANGHTFGQVINPSGVEACCCCRVLMERQLCQSPLQSVCVSQAWQERMMDPLTTAAWTPYSMLVSSPLHHHVVASRQHIVAAGLPVIGVYAI
jgi:hypothetical protein